MRILIVKSSSLGDIVHALPAATAFKQALPEARLDWLIEKRWADILIDHPLIERLVVIDSHGPRGRSLLRYGPSRFFKFLSELRKVHYDKAVDLQRLTKSAALMTLIRARRRYGFGWSSCREWPAALTVSRRAEINYQTDPIREQYLAPLALAAGRELHLPTGPVLQARPRDLDALAEKMPGLDDAGENGFAVALLGGAFGTKLWPSEHWRQVVVWLAAKMPVYLPWMGSRELGVVKMVGQGLAQTVITPELNLGELTALLSRARLVVGGDTGPLHVAAALGRPTVSFYGPTLARRNAPPGHRAIQSPVDCTGCVKRTCPKQFRDCLQELTPEMVWKEIDAELEEN